MKRLEAKLPNNHLAPFYLLNQKMLQTRNARTMTKKALQANIEYKVIKEHQAAIINMSSGPKNSCPSVLEFVEVIYDGKN